VAFIGFNKYHFLKYFRYLRIKVLIIFSSVNKETVSGGGEQVRERWKGDKVEK